MNLRKPSLELEEAYLEFLRDWQRAGEPIIPSAAYLNGLSYAQWLSQKADEAVEERCPAGLVAASLYLLLDEDDKIFGAIHMRHRLNEYLLNFGGHIGYGVAPSCRGHGYAAAMLRMTLPIARQMGIDPVLITCLEGNVASAKTIEACGGVLEDIREENGVLHRRYWIQKGA